MIEPIRFARLACIAVVALAPLASLAQNVAIVNGKPVPKARVDMLLTQAAKGGQVESLRETLVRTKIVVSPLIFDVLRVASKVVEVCTKCNATHHIHFYLIHIQNIQTV